MLNKTPLILRYITLIVLLGNILYFIFPLPPIVWRLALVLLSLFVVGNDWNNDTSGKRILLFIGLNIVYFMLYFTQIARNTSSIVTWMGNILCALSPYFLFVYLGKKGVLTNSFITVLLVSLMVASIFHYYYYENWLISESDYQKNLLGVTNNASTLFVFLFPMVFFIKRKWLAYLVVLICVFFIINSVKRGNILAVSIPILLFLYSIIKNGKKIWSTLFLLGAIVVGIVLIQKWILTNDYFLYRMEITAEGYSSHRDEIYRITWNAWLNSDSIINILFGYGFAKVTTFTHGFAAHNDWFEILVDYGLNGVLIYFFIFISFIKKIKGISDVSLKYAFISALIIWFFKTMYSMAFSENWLSILMITIGTVVGRSYMENSNNSQESFKNQNATLS